VTTFRFQLAHAGSADLKLYDVLGRQAATVFDGHLDAGEHTVSFSAEHLSSGIYFARLRSGVQSATTKVVLLK
jgi:hypothetical protein